MLRSTNLRSRLGFCIDFHLDMCRSNFFRPLVFSLWFIVLCLGFENGHSRTFQFDIHHRFSNTVKEFSERDGFKSLSENWPEIGSVDYYAVLLDHDRFLHKVFRGRVLSGNEDILTFFGGNETFRINSLGFLHYALISVGTPSVNFLVALDTGSDLFWIPCNCTDCAPTTLPMNGDNIELHIYNPSRSLTSRNVPCGNSLCKQKDDCSQETDNCSYKVAYVSANTGSSGFLVEDVLHLITEDNSPKEVNAVVMLGCGYSQTGSFLESAAPNGLFGLGLGKISVPSILAGQGLIADSFSLCFGLDGIGRISFGDQGDTDQNVTPFEMNQIHPMYNISVNEVYVAASHMDTSFSAIFDTGTSFTYLSEPAYTSICESFNSYVQDSRRERNSRVPFEYCYTIGSDRNISWIPTVSLTMKGGGQFPVNKPIVFISDGSDLMYCLSIIKSLDVNIIGQNFMTGHRIVFDREKLILGWKEFNCYDMNGSNTLPIKPGNSTTISMNPNKYIPQATKDLGNGYFLPPDSRSSLGRFFHLNGYITQLFVLLLSLIPV